MKSSKQNPASCSCCEGVDVLTPVTIFNRPGLDSIAYRVGTHGSFLETMKARLSSSTFPMLAALTTRESRDASIALLDGWATVADVLTFYQERIANEGYLGTAIERRSVLELARLVGYRLRPGLAASVYLAYTLEPTQESTVIEAGNKAQSIPGPNETPQVFETAEKLIAQSGLNLMKPRLTQPQFLNSPSLEELKLVVKGASLNLRVNDALLVEFTMLNPVQVQTAFYLVTEVTLVPELDRTSLKLKLQGDGPKFLSTAVNLAAPIFLAVNELSRYLDVQAFGLSPTSKIVEKSSKRLEQLQGTIAGTLSDATKMAALDAELTKLLPYLTSQYAFAFGHGWDEIASWLAEIITDLTALKRQMVLPSTSTGGGMMVKTPEVEGLPSFAEMFVPFKLPQSLQPNGEARLNRSLSQIYGDRSEFVAQMYGVINPQAKPFVKAVLANASEVEIPTPSSRAEGVIELTRSQALRLRTSIAGHNMPRVVQTVGTTTTTLSPPNLAAYLQALKTAGSTSADQNQPLSDIALDGEYSQIQIGSQVMIKHPTVNANGVTTGFIQSIYNVTDVNVRQLVLSGVALSCTVLTLNTPWLLAGETTGASLLESSAVIRNTTVFAQSEDLTLAETEITDDLSFDLHDPNPIIELDGLYSNLEPGRWTIISGERVVIDPRTQRRINTGVEISELVMVSSVAHEAKALVNGGPVELKGEKLHTFLHPAQPPAYRYKRNTVKIYGNVVRATHGETRTEVLGSGDGSKELQSFQLRQPPLTYLAAPNPSGTESTLEVRVNNVRWHEAPNLFVLSPNDRNYITKADDDGKTTVIYGDGEHGARLPTGIENIQAVYRQGIGKGGNVNADQIKLPLTKPLGVKSVNNPLPAGGGVDKETRDQARTNAPIAVLALDRLVSVQDYADFARTFAGIAKANAQRLSDGVREVVHLTIAGAGNIPIDITSDLYRNLVAALGRFGDPLQPLQVESFERVLLIVSAKVSLHPDYLWEVVKEKIRATLWDKLGFDSRELGQGVTQSEVLSLIQAVPGVTYVDLEILDSVSEAKLKESNFGAQLEKKARVNASLAKFNASTKDILPAQLVFLSREAADTLILEEVAE
ncbi:MAG: putative baseplate assembly protein [Pyrinomonadaceae bacterium]